MAVTAHDFGVLSNRELLWKHFFRNDFRLQRYVGFEHIRDQANAGQQQNDRQVEQQTDSPGRHLVDNRRDENFVRELLRPGNYGWHTGFENFHSIAPRMPERSTAGSQHRTGTVSRVIPRFVVNSRDTTFTDLQPQPRTQWHSMYQLPS